MLFAKSVYDGSRIQATYSGQKGVCECCGNYVTAKCGDINIWHFAHDSSDECDSFYEPMSDWHIAWQNWFSSFGAEVEVSMSDGIARHRADVVSADGIIWEIQHSALSTEDIQERERFYGVENMRWLFDMRKQFKAKDFDLRQKDGFHSFRWKHAKKSIAFARAKVFFDFGGGDVFELKKLHAAAPTGGWGYLLSAQDILI